MKREKFNIPLPGDSGVFLPGRSLSYWVERDQKRMPFRYSNVLSLRERLEKRVRDKRRNRAQIDSIFLEPNYPIPPEWKALLHTLYSQGILTHPRVTFDPAFNDEPKLYALRLWANPTVTDGRPEMASGAYSRGVSKDFAEALSKVVGEFLERYSLMAYRNDSFVRASISSLRRSSIPFLDPASASLFSEWQKRRYARRRFDEHSVFNFVRGHSLSFGREAYIPAQLVFINYQLADNEPFLREFNSNGAGGFFTREGAILSGLYELIQRDAFLRTWLLRLVPQRIDQGSLKDPELVALIEDCRRYALEVEFIRCESDLGVPVLVCALIDRTGNGPALTLGGGCSFSEERSMVRAITEAVGVRSWMRANRIYEKTLPLMDDAEPFTEEWGPRRRQFLWDSIDTLPRAAFLFSGKAEHRPHPPLAFDSESHELDHLLSLFRDRGSDYEVFAYEAKHPQLKNLGYHSVRVCVPALLPLYMSETNAPLGAVRLGAHGWGGDVPEERQVNPFPHPFP